MGTTYTPPFRVEYRDQSGRHVQAWESRTQRPYFGPGKPTAAKLEKWRQDMNASFQPGAVNGHIAKAYGFVPHISHARIVRQSTGDVVCETTMPMFEAI